MPPLFWRRDVDVTPYRLHIKVVANPLYFNYMEMIPLYFGSTSLYAIMGLSSLGIIDAISVKPIHLPIVDSFS